MPAYRSFLFAPGNHARKVAKVFDCGADHVILDLEDAVAKAEKVATRALIVEALKRPRKGGAYVRVNAFTTDFCYGDAVAVVGPGLDGIILPMVESREQIVAFDWLVGALERERGLPPGGIDIIPIIETAKGIASARAMAAANPGVCRRPSSRTFPAASSWTRGAPGRTASAAPTTPSSSTTSRIWKRMTSEQRVLAARAFWLDEQAENDQIQAVLLISQQKKFRPKSVIALDVGHGQLDWRLRNDPRVIVREGVNARALTPADLPYLVDLVTIDVSFISLRHILPALPSLLTPGADIMALVKPQFEAGRESVGKGGIVTDPAVHQAVLEHVASAAVSAGLAKIAMAPSPITGATGNQEYFLHLRRAEK